jgi:hypothetical protein
MAGYMLKLEQGSQTRICAARNFEKNRNGDSQNWVAILTFFSPIFLVAKTVITRLPGLGSAVLLPKVGGKKEKNTTQTRQISSNFNKKPQNREKNHSTREHIKIDKVMKFEQIWVIFRAFLAICGPCKPPLSDGQRRQNSGPSLFAVLVFADILRT